MSLTHGKSDLKKHLSRPIHLEKKTGSVVSTVPPDFPAL